MSTLLNKISILIMCALGIIITSCARTSSNVNLKAIENARNESFELGTIKIPCLNIKKFPTSGFKSISDKQHQLGLLDSIKADEILRIISEKYGLNISTNQEVVLDSYPIHFIGFIGDGGRCWYYEGKSDKENKNVVNIEYTFDFIAAPPAPLKLWSGYKVTVESNGSTILENKGEISSLKRSMFKKFTRKEAYDFIITSAKDIPESFKKDIQSSPK